MLKNFLSSLKIAAKLSIVVIAIASTGTVLRAQSVTFNEVKPVSSDSDVDASGVTALAFDWADSLNTTGPTTVHGVKFSGSTTQGSYTLEVSADSGAATYAQYVINNPLSLSKPYVNILTGGTYSANDPAKLCITLSGLKSGTSYVAQFFCYDDRAAFRGSINITTQNAPTDSKGSGALKSGCPDPSNYPPGSFVSAKFVASGSSITFVFNGTGQLNAVNLRDETTQTSN